MDYRLKRQVIALTCVLIIGVLAIVTMANWPSIKRKMNHSSVTVSSAEDVSEEVVEESNNKNVLIGDNPTKWMYDDDFFDGSQIISTAEVVSKDMRTLTISVTSVCNDLRVSVYGYGNILHTGEAFEIHLKNLDNPSETMDYTDADKDGIIYISDLPAVDFAVSLKPVAGYIVPENSTRVKIKDKIERKKIKDIDLIIKEHQPVLSKVEDARVYSGAEERSEDMLVDLEAVDYGHYGVEISSKNDEVDFDTLYSEGIRFVMLRAGYRGARTGAIYEDPSFVDYVSMAKRAGLEIGVYFYSQAIDEREAVEEASALLAMCEDMYVTFPMAIVLDSAGGDGRADDLSSEERTLIASAFADTIRSEEYDTMIFGSSKWLTEEVDVSKLEKYGIWVADLNPVPQYEGVYDLWEYSDLGEIEGLKESAHFIVDMRK